LLVEFLVLQITEALEDKMIEKGCLERRWSIFLYICNRK